MPPDDRALVRRLEDDMKVMWPTFYGASGASLVKDFRTLLALLYAETGRADRAEFEKRHTYTFHCMKVFDLRHAWTDADWTANAKKAWLEGKEPPDGK